LILVGRVAGPHDKLGNWMASDDVRLQPVEKETTISHSPILEVQPYNAAALSDCRSVLEDVVQCRRMLYKGACVLASRDGS
jgi:hypothetical protein